MWGVLKNVTALAAESAQNLTSQATQLLEKLDGEMNQDNQEENDNEEGVDSLDNANESEVDTNEKPEVQQVIGVDDETQIVTKTPKKKSKPKTEPVVETALGDTKVESNNNEKADKKEFVVAQPPVVPAATKRTKKVSQGEDSPSVSGLLQEEVVCLKSLITELTNKMDSMQTKHASEEAKQKEVLGVVHEQLTDAKKKVELLEKQTNILQLQSNLKEIKDSGDAMKNEVANTLNAFQSEFSSMIGALTPQKNAAPGSAENVSMELYAENQEHLKALQSKNDHLKEQLNVLNTKLAASHEVHQQLTVVVEGLKTAKEQYQEKTKKVMSSMKEKHNEEVKQLKTAQETLKAELAALKADQQAALAKLQGERQAALDQLSAQQGQEAMAHQNEAIAQLPSDNETLAGTVKELQEKVKELNQEKQQQASGAEASAESEQLQKELAVLAGAHTELEAELVSVRKQVSDSEQVIEQLTIELKKTLKEETLQLLHDQMTEESAAKGVTNAGFLETKNSLKATQTQLEAEGAEHSKLRTLYEQLLKVRESESEGEMTWLRNANVKLSDANKSLEQRVSALQNELNEAQQQLSSATTDNSASAEQLSAFSALKSDLETELATVKDAHDELTEQKEKLSGELTSLQKQLTAANEEDQILSDELSQVKQNSGCSCTLVGGLFLAWRRFFTPVLFFLLCLCTSGAFRVPWSRSWFNGGLQGHSKLQRCGSIKLDNGSAGRRKNQVRIDIRPCADPAFLNISGLPSKLVGRNELADHLFIRGCYPAMMEAVAHLLKTHSTSHRTGTTAAIVGTPGIGKSSLFLYFLYHHLLDPTLFNPAAKEPSKSFFFQDSPTDVLYFKHVNGSQFTMTFVPSVEAKAMQLQIPLFADIKEIAYPISHEVGNTLIFSSFQPGRYKELTKDNGELFVMPVWSQEEMVRYFDSPQFEATHPGQAAKAKQNIRYFGGSLRNCIKFSKPGAKNPKEGLEAALVRDGGRACDRLFKDDFGGTEADVPDQLIHRTVREVWNNGSVTYPDGFDSIDYQYASSYVGQELWKLNVNRTTADTVNKFATGNAHGPLYGTMFEKLFHQALLYSSLNVTADSLLPKTVGRPKKGAVKLPPTQHSLILPRCTNWWYDLNSNMLKTGVTYIPYISNMEPAVDFAVMDIGKTGNLSLVLIQLSIAEDHSVKLGGILDIWNAAVKANLTISDIRIYFVVNPFSKLDTAQSIKDNIQKTKNSTDRTKSRKPPREPPNPLFLELMERHQQFKVIFDPAADFSPVY